MKNPDYAHSFFFLSYNKFKRRILQQTLVLKIVKTRKLLITLVLNLEMNKKSIKQAQKHSRYSNITEGKRKENKKRKFHEVPGREKPFWNLP